MVGARRHRLAEAAGRSCPRSPSEGRLPPFRPVTEPLYRGSVGSGGG
jgi:hypothetical protein